MPDTSLAVSSTRLRRYSSRPAAGIERSNSAAPIAPDEAPPADTSDRATREKNGGKRPPDRAANFDHDTGNTAAWPIPPSCDMRLLSAHTPTSFVIPLMPWPSRRFTVSFSVAMPADAHGPHCTLKAGRPRPRR